MTQKQHDTLREAYETLTELIDSHSYERNLVLKVWNARVELRRILLETRDELPTTRELGK